MRVAAIQYQPPKGDPAQARAQLCDAVDQAGQAGARVIVCPEMATTGYIWPDAQSILPHAESAGGPTADALGEIAARHRAWVFCGFAERAGDVLYNSMLILDPTGHSHPPYRKILLYVADESWAKPGHERMLVQTEHGSILPGICMDLNDPLFIAHLHQLNPAVLAFSTNWVDEGEDPLMYWRLRLFPWRGGFIAANTWGEDEHTAFTGLSTILDSSGQVLARAPNTGDHIVLADLS